MRHWPHQVRAHQVPSASTRTLDPASDPADPPGSAGGRMARSTARGHGWRVVRRSTGAGARRVLVGGGILVGGWLLLSGLASAAHAAASPLPAPSVPGAGGTVSETLSTIGATARQTAGHAASRPPAPPPAAATARGASARPGGTTSARPTAPAGSSTSAPAARRTGRDVGSAAKQVAGQVTSHLPGRLPALPGAPDGSGGSGGGGSGAAGSGGQAGAGRGSGIAPPGGLGDRGAGIGVSGITDASGVIDSSSVAGLSGVTGLGGLVGTDGLKSLDGLGGGNGLAGGSGLVRQPVAALGQLGAIASPGTAPVGGALTEVLGMGPLGVVTDSLAGVLGQLDRLTGRLVSNLGWALEPVTRIVDPLPKVILPGGLPVPLPGGATGPPRGSSPPSTGPPAPVPWPPGTSTLPAGQAVSAGGGSNSLHVADKPAVPGAPPSGADGGTYAVPVLCGLWPTPTRMPNVPPTHLTGGSGPFTPGGPTDPASGAVNRALPTSSQNDGAGDAPVYWQARITDVFVPALPVGPPAVRTAADEPAFSPD
ncbi:MAG TPA: hypothetical protein VF069_13315 [Streptosporangiaceae bacterium]